MIDVADRTCVVDGCVKSQHGGARGMCPMHYRRVKDHGSTDDPKIDNFRRYVVDLTTDCWVWIGPKNDRGYGTFSRPYRGEKKAHRAFWRKYVGEIAQGMEIDHLCRNRACVNPGHMEAVTHWENMQRSRRGQWGTERCLSGKHDVTGPDAWVVWPSRPDNRHCRKCYEAAYARMLLRRRNGRPPRETHCRNGHEYTPETMKLNKNGTRRCLVCVRNRSREGAE